MHMCTHIYTHAQAYIVCTQHKHTCVHMHVCIWSNMYAQTHTCVIIHMYAYACTHAHIHKYMHAYAHTQTHKCVHTSTPFLPS